MKTNEYAQVLGKAKHELACLEAQRSQLLSQVAEIARRIERQKKGIAGLAHLADQQTMAELPIGAVTPLARYTSFTDAVSYALKTIRATLVPTQVRDRLLLLGYDLDKYKSDPVASIHTILKRLEAAGKVKSDRNEIGKTGYRWISEEEKLEAILAPTSFSLETGGGSVHNLPVDDLDNKD